MLAVDDVTVRFGDASCSTAVDLDVGDGEIVALLGPSGSGKSTLLRVIAGIIAGRLRARRARRRRHHRTCRPIVGRSAWCSRTSSCSRTWTSAGNVGFGLRMAGHRQAPSRRQRVDELLDIVGLAGFGSRRIDGLSGGERKRVALARSLAPQPKLLLLDEPLTGLDRELHDRLAVDVRAILEAHGHDRALGDARRRRSGDGGDPHGRCSTTL